MGQHKVMRLVSTEALTSATAVSVIIESVDISMFDKFGVHYQNESKSGSFIDLQVQHRFDTYISASDAPNWVQIPTATLPQPSALALSAAVLTPPVDNVYKFIRVVGSANTNVAAGDLILTLGGFRA